MCSYLLAVLEREEKYNSYSAVAGMEEALQGAIALAGELTCRK